MRAFFVVKPGSETMRVYYDRDCDLNLIKDAKVDGSPLRNVLLGGSDKR